MENRKKKVIGAAAGAAAAAAATAVGFAAAARIQNQKPAVLHVRSSDDAWIVGIDGESTASGRHATKAEAVNAARELARKEAPSRLVIHRSDGSIQKEHSYLPEA